MTLLVLREASSTPQGNGWGALEDVAELGRRQEAGEHTRQPQRLGALPGSRRQTAGTRPPEAHTPPDNRDQLRRAASLFS